MVLNLGPRLLTVPVKNDEIGLLLRHMTTDTVAGGLVPYLREHGGLRLVATQTMLGENQRIMLAAVNVVASQACHCRALEAAAFFEQFDLAAVHINLRVRIGRRQFQVFVQRFAGNIGEGRGKRRALAGVAPSAQV